MRQSLLAEKKHVERKIQGTPPLRGAASLRSVACTRLLIAALAGCLCIAISGDVHAEGAPQRGPLFFPTGPGAGEVRIAAGASLDILPRRLVEAEQRELPKVTGNIRFGLPAGFSTDARLSAIVVANEFQIGAAWSQRVRDVSFSIQEHFGLWFGYVGTAGFDASAWGVLNTPGVSIGAPMGYVRFTLGWELLLLQGQHVNVGDGSVNKRKISYEGHMSSLTVENLLDCGGVIYFGLGVIYSRPDYQLWLAFSDANKKTIYPRFVAGYEF